MDENKENEEEEKKNELIKESESEEIKEEGKIITIKEDKINTNEKEKICSIISKNDKDNSDNELAYDHYIFIKFTNLLKIPYFIFGSTINFYSPCTNFTELKMKLSEVPNPPFVIHIDGKFLYLTY